MLKQYFVQVKPSSQLLYLLVIIFLSGTIISFVGSVASFFIYGIDDTLTIYKMADMRVEVLRYLQAISQIGFFLVPCFVFSKLFSDSHSSLFPLKYEKKNLPIALLFLLLLVVSIPFTGWVYYLNKSVDFPNFLHSIEAYFKATSAKNEMIISKLLADSSLRATIGNLLVICILPAISEELLFRGVLQNTCIKILRRNHLSIFLIAMLFSAIHFDFYGFLPRFTLGLLLGYSFFLTKNMLVPILIHFTNNLIAFLFSFFHVESDFSETYSQTEVLFVIVSALLCISCSIAIYCFVKNRNKHKNSCKETPTL